MRRRDLVKAAAALPLLGLEVGSLEAVGGPSSRAEGSASRPSVVPALGDAVAVFRLVSGRAVRHGRRDRRRVRRAGPAERRARPRALRGLTCAMTAHPPEVPDALRQGWNRAEHHEYLRSPRTAVPTRGRGRRRLAGADLLLGQPRRLGRRRRPGDHGPRPRGRAPGRRAAGRDAVPRAVQLQDRPPGLPGRFDGVGRGARRAAGLAPVPAALRRLPHADHGGRRDPHGHRPPRRDRPFPRRRRAGPPRTPTRRRSCSTPPSCAPWTRPGSRASSARSSSRPATPAPPSKTPSADAPSKAPFGWVRGAGYEVRLRGPAAVAYPAPSTPYPLDPRSAISGPVRRRLRVRADLEGRPRPGVQQD